jgi:hypothetical protein
MVSPIRASDGASGPLHEQMLPTTIGVPLTFDAEPPVDALPALVLAIELLVPAALSLELLVLPQAVTDATIPTIRIATAARLMG